MKLEKGDRVLVLAHWNWPRAWTGRIAIPPEIPGVPQRDGDGDGPHVGGEVETEYPRAT